MAFMEMEMTRKGSLVSCDCSHCGAPNYTHEWASWDFNEERDAMQAGTFHCGECGRPVGDVEVWESPSRNYYAARMSAPGYLDCTQWDYGTNKRNLAREVQAY